MIRITGTNRKHTFHRVEKHFNVLATDEPGNTVFTDDPVHAGNASAVEGHARA